MDLTINSADTALGDLVLSMVVGGGVALARWLFRPQAARGNLAVSLLLWIGFLTGFSVLRRVFVTVPWLFW